MDVSPDAVIVGVVCDERPRREELCVAVPPRGVGVLLTRPHTHTQLEGLRGHGTGDIPVAVERHTGNGPVFLYIVLSRSCRTMGKTMK